MALIVGIINIVLAILVILGIVPGVMFAWIFLGGTILLSLATTLTQVGSSSNRR